jgi:hypothetical protein
MLPAVCYPLPAASSDCLPLRQPPAYRARTPRMTACRLAEVRQLLEPPRAEPLIICFSSVAELQLALVSTVMRTDDHRTVCDLQMVLESRSRHVTYMLFMGY